jgi:hypothetical protein
MQPPPLVYRGEEAPEKPGWPTSISNSAGGLTALACTAVTSNAAGTARTPRGAGSQTVRLVSSEVLLGPHPPPYEKSPAARGGAAGGGALREDAAGAEAVRG